MKKTMLVVSTFALVLVLGASAFASTDEGLENCCLKNFKSEKHLEMAKVFESGDFNSFVSENPEMAEFVDLKLFGKMSEMHKLRSEIRTELEEKGFMGRGFGMGKEGERKMMKMKKGDGSCCENFVQE